MSTAAPIVHIVDDDASFLAATSRLLRASGFAVKTFRVGVRISRAAQCGGCGLRGGGFANAGIERTRSAIGVGADA